MRRTGDGVLINAGAGGEETRNEIEPRITAWTGHDGFSSIEGLHSSGAIIALEVMLTPLRDADGRTEAVFALFRRPPD